MDNGACQTPMADHIARAIDLMQRGARMRLDAIPGDSSMSSSGFGPDVTAEIAKRLTAPEAKSGVAVKALEWEWPNEYGLICRAKTSIGTYSISDNEDSSGGSLLCYLHLTEEADSTRWAIEIFHGYAELDEVQAAAQSDCETRIRSALVDPEGGV